MQNITGLEYFYFLENEADDELCFLLEVDDLIFYFEALIVPHPHYLYTVYEKSVIEKIL